MSLFQVGTVTNPTRPGAGRHRDRAVISADLFQCQIAPGVSHGGNRFGILLRSNRFLGEQLFVTQIFTGLKRHSSGDYSGKSTADQSLRNWDLVTVVRQGRSL